MNFSLPWIFSIESQHRFCHAIFYALMVVLTCKSANELMCACVRGGRWQKGTGYHRRQLVRRTKLPRTTLCLQVVRTLELEAGPGSSDTGTPGTGWGTSTMNGSRHCIEPPPASITTQPGHTCFTCNVRPEQRLQSPRARHCQRRWQHHDDLGH